MAPRGGSGGWYNDGDYSPWTRKVQLHVSSYGGAMRRLITSVVFEFITLGALLLFLIWACALRPREIPRGSLICSILSLMIAESLMIVYDFFFIFSAVVTRSYVVMLMIRELFELLWAILLFYVFYQLLRGYLQRIANGSNRFSAIHSFHWVVIVILSALSAAQWSVYIADQVYNVEGNDQFIWLLDVYIKLFSVRYILCWVISLELLVWIAFVAFKSGAHRFSVRTGAIFFAIGGVFLFTYNFAMTIIYIRYNLEERRIPSYTGIVISAITTICTIGIYSGVIACCLQWQNTSDEHRDPIPDPVAYGQPPLSFSTSLPYSGQQPPQYSRNPAVHYDMAAPQQMQQQEANYTEQTSPIRFHNNIGSTFYSRPFHRGVSA